MSALVKAEPISGRFSEVAASFPVVTSPKEFLARFDEALAKTGCEIAEFKNPDSVTTPAEYKGFEWFPGLGVPTFVNKMRLVTHYPDPKDKQKKIPRPEAEVTVSKWHEGFHAIQDDTVPALHFTPYNMGNLNIVLSPASYMLMTLLTERAAATATSLLGYADGSPEIRAAVAKEAATVEDFEQAMDANNQRLDLAMNRVARECLMKNSNEYMLSWGKFGQRPKNEALWLRNYYVWQAFKEYTVCNRFNYADKLYDSPRPIFVRLGPEDVSEIGNVLGVNAFGGDGNPDEFFVQMPTLLPRLQEGLRGLNIMNGVPDESELMTIKQALALIYGITPQEALEFSKKYKHGDPVIEPHGPESRKIVPFVQGVYSQPQQP